MPLDNKGQPSEALITMQKMLDENIPVMLNCGPSNIASALIAGVDKNNERNPAHRIVYVNCGGLAPELTNEQWNFWHFRTSAHAGMQAEIMVRALPKEITKVYLINQDYLFGQSAQRDLKLFMAKLRPDIQVVGEEMIPLGKIKDFSVIHLQDPVVRRPGAVDRQLGARPDPPDQSRHGDRPAGRPLHDAGPSRRDPNRHRTRRRQAVHSVLSFHENVPAENNDAARMAWVEAFRAKNDFDYIFGDRWAAVELSPAASKRPARPTR